MRAALLAIAALLVASPAVAGATKIAGPGIEAIDNACIEGLTPGRTRELLQWAAGEMGVPGDVPLPAIRCASMDSMRDLYVAAGGDRASGTYLGIFVRPTERIYISDERRFPDGNEHLIVHEIVHYLQHASGSPLDFDEREQQATSIHHRWMWGDLP